MRLTHYQIPCERLDKPLQIALAADLHDNPHDKVLATLQAEHPDLILIPGDLTDDIEIQKGAERALHFLRGCAAIAPTYYSPGNHEIRCYHRGNPFRHPIPSPIPRSFFEEVRRAGAILLDNELVTEPDGLTVCGLSSGICGDRNEPDAAAIQRFAAAPGRPKLLLCHHPEYYAPYLSGLDFDLTVCGHAHGGHWRFFGRGVYAPGQGLFPKYTSGTVGGRCVISRGIGNHTRIPRIFNPTELVIITLGGKEQK